MTRTWPAKTLSIAQSMGGVDLWGTIQEMETYIEALEIAKQAMVAAEDYSGADRILKSIARVKSRIAEANGGDSTKG